MMRASFIALIIFGMLWLPSGKSNASSLTRDSSAWPRGNQKEKYLWHNASAQNNGWRYNCCAAEHAVPRQLASMARCDSHYLPSCRLFGGAGSHLKDLLDERTTDL